MKRLSSNDIKELKRLRKKIMDGAEATSRLIQSAKERSREALSEAILCGQALNRVKEIVGFGGFGRWLKENCKGLSQETARRWMRISNQSHVTDHLTTNAGLRQAYIALGIITEDELETKETTVNEPTKKPILVMKAEAVNAAGKKALPEINKDDALSRPRYLVKQLLLDIQCKIEAGVCVADLEAATLVPLRGFFEQQHKGKESFSAAA